MTSPTPAAITLIGAGIAALGGIVAACGLFLASQESAKKSDQIAQASEANAALSRTIAAKSDEIARINTKIAGSVTGGDSFVYLEPLRRGGRVRYFVRQSGQYPTYDVVVRVQDGEQRLLFGPVEVGRKLIRGSGFDWTYPDRQPNGHEWPLVFPEPPNANVEGRKFRVEIAARNGIVVQHLRIWSAHDRWQTDSKNIERPGVGPLTLPDDFREAQGQP